MPVEGLDVSHHQGIISWPEVAVSHPTIAFCFIKATEGTTFLDTSFAYNRHGCTENGIIPGAYHYLSLGNGARQAEFYAKILETNGGFKGLIQPVVDVEETYFGNKAIIYALDEFLRRAKELFGVSPIIYTYPYFWIRQMGNPMGYGEYPLWYAHYANAIGPLPASWKYWSFWQYTSTGRVNGIKTIVDRNVWNGSLTNLQKFVIK